MPNLWLRQRVIGYILQGLAIAWCSKKRKRKPWRQNNFGISEWKVGHKSSVIWNHKDSDLIHVDPNHTNLNQPIPYYSTNIGSINYSANINVIEKIFSLPVHLVHTPYPVPTPQIFTYGTEIEPRSPLHDSSAECVTSKRHLTPHNNLPNPVPNVPADPGSDPIFSGSSSPN